MCGPASSPAAATTRSIGPAGPPPGWWRRLIRTLATVEFLKRDRGGRVFVDWLRNGPIATSVVPWSLRPRPGAPVAVPITWDELDDVTPDGFTLGPDSLAPIADRLALDLPLPPPAPLPVDDLAAAAQAAGIDLATTQDRFGRRSDRS